MSDQGTPRTLAHPSPSRKEAEVEFNRIVAFSDGVFAIAITLLVLTLEVPPGVEDLGEELRKRDAELFAYALSFAVLGKLWLAHHRFFGTLERFDGRLLALNLVYLAFVALVPFTSDLLGNYSGQTEAVVAYALNQFAVVSSFAIQITYSYRRGLIQQWARPYQARFAGPANYLIAAVFAISIPIAWISTTAATFVWLATFLVGNRAADIVARRLERP